MNQYSPLQEIKRRFFAMRNGVIADTMRRAEAPYRMIFGLNLPQIREIAQDYAPNHALGLQLLTDVNTRESQLLAPMLMDVDALTAARAASMLEQSPSAEAIDVMCMRLLRNHPQAVEVIALSLKSQRELTRYGALRLAMNLLTIKPDTSAEVARKAADSVTETDSPLLRSVKRQIADELEFKSRFPNIC